MGQKHLISIVIIGYNTKNELHELLLSINKITNQSIEIVYVDDGSQDRSYDLFKNFKTQHMKNGKKLIKNKGRSYATQHAIDMANGAWLFFVRSNEVLFLDTLDQYMHMSKSYTALAFAGSVQYCGKEKRLEQYLNGSQHGIKKYQTGNLINFKHLLFNNSFIHCSVFKKIKLNSALVKYGGEELDFSYRFNSLYPRQIRACPQAKVLRKNYPSLKVHCSRLFEFGHYNLRSLNPTLQKEVVKLPFLLYFNLNFLITPAYILLFFLYKINFITNSFYIIKSIMLCAILRGYYKGS